MIGLSLSLCVRDILDGKVKESDVEKIVTNTCAYDTMRWAWLLNSYHASYWQEHPIEECARLLTRLRAAGKIIQPHIDDRDYVHFMPDSSNPWVVDEVSYQEVLQSSKERMLIA